MNLITDTYGSVKELTRAHTEGRDFTIHVLSRPSHLLVVAPHGGRIEVGTSDIAKAIAGDDFSLYLFDGLIGAGEDEASLRLHITSTRFREPRLEALLSEARFVIAVHGANGNDEAFVILGGRDEHLRETTADALKAAGFLVCKPREGLLGLHADNIVNRGLSGKGLQLELSRKLRRDLHDNPEAMLRFVYAIRGVLRPDTE